MSIASVSTQPNLLKKTFGKDLETMTYGKSELLTRAKKNTKFGGEDFSFTIRVTPTAGSSLDFGEALASQAESQIAKFTVPFRKMYTILGIDNELIARAKAAGNMGAFDDALKSEAKAGLEAFSEMGARQAWQTGGGASAQLHASVNLASTTLQVRIRSDIVGFNPKQYLQFSTDDGIAGAGLRGGGTTVRIVSINRTAGTAVVDALLNTVPSITANDFIFIRGAYGRGWGGNAGWVPVTDPSATAWMGHDRTSLDILRTSGMRVSGNGRQMIETLHDAAAECKMNGTPMPCLFMSPLDRRVLNKELQSQVYYEGGDIKVGIKPKMMIDLDSGPCELISEPWVQQGFSWGGDPKDFEVRTAGEFPELLADENGKLFRFREGADAREGRMGAYGNYVNHNPGRWTAITWA